MALTEAVNRLHGMIREAEHILVLQPEKPDTDSLTSSLALEELLGEQGKRVTMYCRDELPRYISYFDGADRVTDEFPASFDCTILVDTGGPQQLGRTLEKHQSALSRKPFAIIDHHGNRQALPIESLEVVDDASLSTCELVVKIANQLEWKLTKRAADLLIPGVLADTRNLSIPTTTPEAFELMAQLMRAGGDLARSHENYRAASALAPELLRFKGELLSRVELFDEGRIALVVVQPDELKRWAETHDPSDLVIYDMQRASGVQIAVVFRNYGGKIKVSTRANAPVAAKTCAAFGGGGHDRAAGCQINDQPASEAITSFVAELIKQLQSYQDAPDKYLN